MKWSTASLISLALVCSAIAQNAPSMNHTSPVIELLIAGNFTTFRDELVKYNLTDLIHSTGLLTIFAPVNEAFLSSTNGTRRYPEWKEVPNENRIKMLRRCFVTGTKLLPIDMKNDMELRSASGEQLRINVYPGIRLVNGLMLTRNPSLQTHDIIVYRTQHLMRAALPGNNLYAALTIQSKNQQDRFSKLIQAIDKAGLKDQLATGGPFTLFAATNNAFNTHPDKTALATAMDSPTLLKKLVLSHVMNGTYFLSGLLSVPEQHTLDGGSNRIFLAGPGNVTLGGARVITGEGPPMLATNGIIYTIDRVLMR